MSYRVVYKDELYHHGIIGQQWGVRNGPPYPLGESDKSASEKKEKTRKSLQLTDKQKKIAKIGAAVFVTGLAAYGAYKIAKNGTIIKPAYAITKSISAGKSPLEIDTEMVASINNANKGTFGGKINCVHCTTSYILNSLFGWDTTAKPFSGIDEASGLVAKGRSVKLFDAIFSNLNHIQIPNSDTEPIDSIISRIPNGSTGILIRSDWVDGSSHVINYEKTLNGVLTIIDGQTGKVYDNPIEYLLKNQQNSRYIEEIIDFSNARLSSKANDILPFLIDY